MNNISRASLFILLIVPIGLPAIDQTNEKPTYIDQLIMRQKWQPGTPLRLHLGCGENYFPGYINIDFPSSEHTVQTKSPADMHANITELQFPANSVDEVRSHHVFEHFTRQETLAMLCAWHSWLKIDGIVVIETPDFDASIKQLASSEYDYKTKQAILRHVFGSHEARWAIHCDGWYKEKYEHILTQLGFEIVSIHYGGYLMIRNIIVTAKKITNLDPESLAIRAKDILRESLVVPCEEALMQPIWEKDFEKTLNKMIIPSFLSMNTCLNTYQDTSLNKMGYNDYNMYSNGKSLVIQEFINPGDIIFDVGASIGEWSQAILSKNSVIKLYAFEPIADIFAQLKQTIKTPRAILLNIAISDDVGSRQFVYYQKNNTTSQLSGFFQRPIVERNLDVLPTFLTVETDTIDHFCARNSIDTIDFLKIDTEGAELLVFQGATDMLKQQKIKIIQFEYGGTYQDSKITLQEVYQLLRANKYTVFRIVPDGLIQIEKWHDELENYQYSNYLATCDGVRI